MSSVGPGLPACLERRLEPLHLDYMHRPGLGGIHYSLGNPAGVARRWAAGCHRCAFAGSGQRAPCVLMIPSLLRSGIAVPERKALVDTDSATARTVVVLASTTCCAIAHR
jgi:hypothetical protein